MWPFKNKSAFNCSFYDDKIDNKILERNTGFKKTYTDKKEEEKKDVSEVIIRRGIGEPLSERLTNINFGLRVNHNKENDRVTLPAEQMMVAILMDIRERLDTIIELQHKVAKDKKEIKIVKTKGKKK